MATVGDIFSLTILTEHDGVQASNRLYYKIDDLGVDPSISLQVAEMLNEFHDACKAVNSDIWKIVCGIYDNQTTPEGTHVIFSSLAGLVINTGHPQFQVFRFNEYAMDGGSNTIKRGAFNLGGVAEVHSVRGRVNAPASFSAMVAWLKDPFLLGADGWTISPQLRWTFAPGPPPTYVYLPMTKVQIATKVFTLQSRHTQLCATT